jgi:hypothetical protein
VREKLTRQVRDLWREARVLSAVLAATGALLATSAAAVPLISGTVTARNGTPLADVQVQVEIASTATAAPTDAHGRFQFDAGTLFSSTELRDAGGLMLKLAKPGFQSVNRLVRLTSGQAPAPVTVQLDASGGSAALPAADKQALDKYVAAPGSAPLFLVPYALSGIESLDPKSVNEMLRANLERVIVTHVQAIASGGPPVSLKLLPVQQGGDIDRMRAYGTYLNALAMITGYGAVAADDGRPGVLGVSSTFLVVPQADSLGATVLYVDDDVPADRVGSPRLYQHLSKLWGRSAVLAMGVSEFGKAKAGRDKEALKRIRKYLQTERAGAGPSDELLVAQLNTLIEAVDRELAK